MTEIADRPARCQGVCCRPGGLHRSGLAASAGCRTGVELLADALHMVDCLYFYAMQVVYGQPDGYLCTELALDDSASPPAVAGRPERARRAICTALHGPLTQICARIIIMVSRTRRGSPLWAS